MATFKTPLQQSDSLNPEKETRESALAKIKAWADEKSQYDLDDWRAYLYNDESDYIDRAVEKYGITKAELQGLNKHFFQPYYGYSQYGYDPEETLDQYKKRLGRDPSANEYKAWTRPKIRRDYNEYLKQGLDARKIYDELYDAYGYEDIIKETMGDNVIPIGSKSKFAQKYPDRFEKIKGGKQSVFGKGRTYEDVDWDYIAKALGVDLD